MSRNLTLKQIGLLRALRRVATLENAAFDHVGPAYPPVALPTDESQVTHFIRERTRLYRETWLIPVIDQLLQQGRRS